MAEETILEYDVVEREVTRSLCDNCEVDITADGLQWRTRVYHDNETMVDEILCEACATTRDTRRLSFRHLRERPLIEGPIIGEVALEANTITLMAVVWAVLFMVAFTVDLVTSGYATAGMVIKWGFLWGFLTMLAAPLAAMFYDLWRI